MTKGRITHETSVVKRILKSKLAIICEIVILVVLSSALAKEVLHKYQIQSEIRKLQEEVAQLEQKNIEMNSLISYFKSEPFKEEQARLKLGLQKSGELVIAVLGESTENTEDVQKVAAVSQKNVVSVSNPQRWWEFFLNNKN